MRWALVEESGGEWVDSLQCVFDGEYEGELEGRESVVWMVGEKLGGELLRLLVGESKGSLLGELVGLALGLVLGTFVGMFDRLTVGKIVTISLVCCVAETICGADGVFIVMLVGMFDGWVVGKFVGWFRNWIKLKNPCKVSSVGVFVGVFDGDDVIIFGVNDGLFVGDNVRSL